jgi:hypothetical protein
MIILYTYVYRNTRVLVYCTAYTRFPQIRDRLRLTLTRPGVQFHAVYPTSHPAKLICKFRHMCATGPASRVIGLPGFIRGPTTVCGTLRAASPVLWPVSPGHTHALAYSLAARSAGNVVRPHPHVRTSLLRYTYVQWRWCTNARVHVGCRRRYYYYYYYYYYFNPDL